jgi:hypothetical protein
MGSNIIDLLEKGNFNKEIIWGMQDLPMALTSGKFFISLEKKRKMKRWACQWVTSTNWKSPLERLTSKLTTLRANEGMQNTKKKNWWCFTSMKKPTILYVVI